jgi:predicted dehydrogenase
VDPDLPWDWWSERDKGGGQLLALGSHMVDLVRWWLGDVLAVRADLRTGHDVRQHNGQPMPVTSDEMANMMLTMEGDIPVQIITSSLAHHAPGISVHLIGQSGSLVLEGYDHLRLVIDEEEQDVGEVDDLLGEPEVGENPWRTSLVRYGRHIVNALRGDGVFAGATFADGFEAQRVLDAALESHACKKTIVLANRKEFS